MNSNTYRIGFFVLLVINIALLVIFTMRPEMPMQQRGLKDEISRELNFTEEQKAMFDKMAENHHEAIRELEKQEQELLRSFFQQLSLDYSKENKEAQLEHILQLEKDKIIVTYNHFEELKEMCNEEQLKRFDRVMERILPVLINSSDRPMKPERPPF